MPGGEEYAALFFTDGAEDAMTALALLKSDGSIRWGPVKLGSYGEGTDISATPDGRFIYVSSLGSPDISGRLTKVSAINGDVLWSKFYRFPCRFVLSLPVLTLTLTALLKLVIPISLIPVFLTIP